MSHRIIGIMFVAAAAAACEGATSPVTMTVTGPTAFEPAPAPYTPPAVQVLLTPGAATIGIGQSVTINAQVIGGDDGTDRTVKWTSVEEIGSSIAIVGLGDKFVDLMGMSPGVIVLTASHASGASERARITVVDRTSAVRGEFVMDESMRFNPQLTMTAANVDFLARSMIFTKSLQESCGIAISWSEGFNAFVQLTGTGAYKPGTTATGTGSFPFTLAGAALRADFSVTVGTDGVEVIRTVTNPANGQRCVAHRGTARASDLGR